MEENSFSVAFVFRKSELRAELMV